MTKQHNAEMCQSVFHRVKKSEGGPSNRLLFIEIAGEGRFMIAARRASPKIEGVMPEHHALSFAPNETMHHGKEALRHAIVQKWTGPLVTCWYGMMVRKVA